MSRILTANNFSRASASCVCSNDLNFAWRTFLRFEKGYCPATFEYPLAAMRTLRRQLIVASAHLTAHHEQLPSMWRSVAPAIHLRGELAAMLALCACVDVQKPPAVCTEGVLQIKMVAGVGFEPTTFRL